MTWGKRHDFFPADQAVAFVDIETTGLSPRNDVIIELAAIVVRPGNPRHEGMTCLLKTGRKVPRRIAALTGITDALIERDGHDPDYALDYFCKLVADVPLVAFNASFDMAFLDVAVGARMPRSARRGHACALHLSRKSWPFLARHRLSDVAAHLAIASSQSHRALDDATMCMQIYYRALGVPYVNVARLD